MAIITIVFHCCTRATLLALSEIISHSMSGSKLKLKHIQFYLCPSILADLRMTLSSQFVLTGAQKQLLRIPAV
jgi:hypothetical protein